MSMRSRGRGAFALRKDLKAAAATICSLKRDRLNEFGAISVLADVFKHSLCRLKSSIASPKKALNSSR